MSLGEGGPEFLENAYSGEIRMTLGGRTSTSPRYVTDITGLDPLSLVELGGGGRRREEFGKTRKNELFLTYEWVIKS